MPRSIYLDMDGVLADFDGAIAVRGVVAEYGYHHLPMAEWTPEQCSRDEQIRLIMDQPDFWPSLNVMPGALDLVLAAIDLVGRENVFILTALPRLTWHRERIAFQKTAWASAMLLFPPNQVITCLRADKQSYAGSGNVLIDDMAPNCAEWTASGGVAIHHADATTSIQRLRENFGWFPSRHAARRQTQCLCGLCTLERAAEPEFVVVGAAIPGHPKLGLPTEPAARKAVPLYTGVMRYFPDALAAVAEVSKLGNDQHNPGQPLHWSRGKSNDHANCAARHSLTPADIDPESGEVEAAHGAWRALATLQLLEEKRLAAAGIMPYSGITS